MEKILQYNGGESETYELVAEWLDDYKSTRDQSKRAKSKALIVSRMLPVVKKIARTIARRSYDPIDDMVQAGSIGLLKAIDSYSSELNDNFKIYAGYLIIGEMKHYLRDKLNTIRVPRHVQELSYRINSFISTLTPEELDDLTNDYVAEALNIPAKVVDYAMQADRRKSTLSLDDVFGPDDDNLGYEEILTKDNYKEEADLEDTKLILRNVINKLPDDIKSVIELYYYKDMNQKEIAAQMNMTQMQISRRLKKAYALISEILKDSDIEFPEIEE